MHRAIQRRYGRRRRSFRGRRRSLFSRHHLHHRFHTLSPNKRHLSFDSPQTRIRRSRLIHCTMDRRSVCFSRSFSTTNAGYSKFPFFPYFYYSASKHSASPSSASLFFVFVFFVCRAFCSLHHALSAPNAASQHAVPRGPRRGNAAKLRRSEWPGVSSRVSNCCDPTSPNWGNRGSGTSSTPSSPRSR